METDSSRDPFTERVIGLAIAVHRALGPGLQMLTYLRLSRIRTGLLINFSTVMLKDGLRRFVL